MITSMFLGCFFGSILYLAKEKKLLVSLDLKITKPIIIFTIFITISYLFVYLRIYDYLFFYRHFFRDYALSVNLHSSNYGYNMATYQYMNYLCGFLFLFLLSKVNIGKRFIKKLFYTLFVTNSIVFLALIYQITLNPYFLGQSNLIGEHNWIAAHTFVNRYGSTLVDPNSLGVYSIIILVAFIGFIYYFQSKNKRILSGIVITECLILLMSSGSRTGLSGLLVIILVYLFILLLIFIIVLTL